MIKRYLIYFLLLPILASCTDDDAPARLPQEDTAYQVTGSIRSMLSSSPRAIDNEQGTAFEANDEILIGLDGSDKTYTYVYSPDKNIFSPGSTDNDKGLWSELIAKGSSNADIYAWFKNTSSTTALPSLNSTLSVAQNQTTKEGYESSLYMAAHIRQAGTATTLNFTFAHLVCRLKLSIDFNDKSILYSDVQNAVVKMRLYTSATVGKNEPNGDYKLTVDATNAPTDDIDMLTKWDDKNASHLESVCLLPPQTLTAEYSVITITLNNGKEYTCTLSKDLPLEAGTEAKIPIKIEVGGTSVYEPVVSVVPQTKISSYSGNRLITANNDNTLSVYDKQADGSWGTPSMVYESLDSEKVFQPTDYEGRALDLYTDYVAYSTGEGTTNGKTYFCKRDKRTGKWYKANGPLKAKINDDTDRISYTISLNEHFLVAGGANQSSSVTIYPIDADGNLNENGTYFGSLSGFKLSLAENDVLCTANYSYQLSLNGTTVEMVKLKPFSADRIASDGYKVILQKDKNVIRILNISTGTTETIQDAPYAGVGLPVAIYDKYALVGGNGDGTNFFSTDKKDVDWLLLLYYDGTKWIHIGSKDDPDSFLNLLRKYAPNDAMTGDDFHLEGVSIVMKGTRAVIQSHKKTYFVENIDELADKWLKDNSSSTNN